MMMRFTCGQVKRGIFFNSLSQLFYAVKKGRGRAGVGATELYSDTVL